MEPRSARPYWNLRALGVAITAIAALGTGPTRPGALASGLKRPDPAQILPMDQVSPHAREGVAEIIRDSNFHRRGKPETFPCNPRVYMKLLNEPALTLALWQDLGPTPAKLRQIAPGKYQGNDGAGTNATWEFVLRSPRLNVLLCDLDYASPRGNARLNGRIVMVVRSGYFREVNGDFWVQQDLEAFVKIDSRGWKAVAVTLKPLIEKLLEEQVHEAGLYVSLMGRLVEAYPDWAASITKSQAQLPEEIRTSFLDVVKETRRPNASPGRPEIADSGTTRIK